MKLKYTEKEGKDPSYFLFTIEAMVEDCDPEYVKSFFVNSAADYESSLGYSDIPDISTDVLKYDPDDLFSNQDLKKYWTINNSFWSVNEDKTIYTFTEFFENREIVRHLVKDIKEFKTFMDESDARHFFRLTRALEQFWDINTCFRTILGLND